MQSVNSPPVTGRDLAGLRSSLEGQLGEVSQNFNRSLTAFSQSLQGILQTTVTNAADAAVSAAASSSRQQIEALHRDVESRFANISGALASSSASARTAPANQELEAMQAIVDNRFTSFAQELKQSLSNITVSIQGVRAGGMQHERVASETPNNTHIRELEQLQHSMENRLLELGQHFDSRLQGISTTLQTTVSNAISSQHLHSRSTGRTSGQADGNHTNSSNANDGNVADDESDEQRTQLPRNGHAARARDPNLNLLQVCCNIPHP